MLIERLKLKVRLFALDAPPAGRQWPGGMARRCAAWRRCRSGRYCYAATLSLRPILLRGDAVDQADTVTLASFYGSAADFWRQCDARSPPRGRVGLTCGGKLTIAVIKNQVDGLVANHPRMEPPARPCGHVTRTPKIGSAARKGRPCYARGWGRRLHERAAPREKARHPRGRGAPGARSGSARSAAGVVAFGPLQLTAWFRVHLHGCGGLPGGARVARGGPGAPRRRGALFPRRPSMSCSNGSCGAGGSAAEEKGRVRLTQLSSKAG